MEFDACQDRLFNYDFYMSFFIAREQRYCWDQRKAGETVRTCLAGAARRFSKVKGVLMADYL